MVPPIWIFLLWQCPHYVIQPLYITIILPQHSLRFFFVVLLLWFFTLTPHMTSVVSEGECDVIMLCIHVQVEGVCWLHTWLHTPCVYVMMKISSEGECDVIIVGTCVVQTDTDWVVSMGSRGRRREGTTQNNVCAAKDTLKLHNLGAANSYKIYDICQLTTWRPIKRKNVFAVKSGKEIKLFCR